jgi:perosamine synthetase
MIIQDKIGATVYYNPPVHKTPYYEKTMMMISSKTNLLTNTNWASEHVLSLPVHLLITEMDIERIADNFNKHLRIYAWIIFIQNILSINSKVFYS